VASTRAKLPQDLVRIDKAVLGDIHLGFPKGLVQRGTLGVVEPIAGIKRQQFDFGALRQIRRFVEHQTP